jgi:hypothetical protein
MGIFRSIDRPFSGRFLSFLIRESHSMALGHKSFLRVYSFKFLLTIILPFTVMACAGQMTKAPQSLPAIVKEYKSMTIVGGKIGTHDSGVSAEKGDYYTIVADGAMFNKSGQIHPPERVLSFQLGRTGNEINYSKMQKYFLADKSDRLYIEYRLIKEFGTFVGPQYMQGHFYIDIIVWRKYDPGLMANFLEELAKNSPNRDALKQFAESFKKENKIFLAEQKAKEEVNAAQKALAAKESQKVPSGKPSAQEAEMAVLMERLQKSLQELKEVEDLKKTMGEQKEREKELLSRLDRLEEEKAQQFQKQPNLPFIALASPQDRATVRDPYVNLVGFAEHELGIAKLQILVNGELVSLREERGLGDEPS